MLTVTIGLLVAAAVCVILDKPSFAIVALIVIEAVRILPL
jgi:hypothetical protein